MLDVLWLISRTYFAGRNGLARSCRMLSAPIDPAIFVRVVTYANGSANELPNGLRHGIACGVDAFPYRKPGKASHAVFHLGEIVSVVMRRQSSRQYMWRTVGVRFNVWTGGHITFSWFETGPDCIVHMSASTSTGAVTRAVSPGPIAANHIIPVAFTCAGAESMESVMAWYGRHECLRPTGTVRKHAPLTLCRCSYGCSGRNFVSGYIRCRSTSSISTTACFWTG